MKKSRKRVRHRVGRVSYYPHHGSWHLYYQQDDQTVRNPVPPCRPTKCHDAGIHDGRHRKTKGAHNDRGDSSSRSHDRSYLHRGPISIETSGRRGRTLLRRQHLFTVKRAAPGAPISRTESRCSKIDSIQPPRGSRLGVAERLVLRRLGRPICFLLDIRRDSLNSQQTSLPHRRRILTFHSRE